MKKSVSFKNFIVCSLIMLVIHVSSFAQTKPSVKPTNKSIFQLGSLFKNHMILQRNMLIPIWGKATVGSIIKIEYANSEKETIADSSGKWRLDLKALKASCD